MFGNSNSAFGNQSNNSGSGLFGNNNSNASLTGMFGANTNQQPSQSGAKPLFGSGAASGGLFGNANSNTNTSGGLFGNNTNNNVANNNPTNPNLNTNTLSLGFGSTNTGGLFGNNNSTNTSGGLFGNNANTNSNTTSGGLFGNNNANTNTSGGLFGNNNANTNTLGGLFGNNSNTTASGGLFGNNANTSTNTSGLAPNSNTSTNNSGGLFGNANSNTNTTSGGLFGNNNNTGTNTNTGSGGLFGNNTNTNTTANSGGLFGNSAQKPGGLFGSTPQNSTQDQKTGLLGNNASTTASSGLFGTNNTASTNSTGLLGSNNNNQGLNTGLLNANLPLSEKDKSVYTPSITDQMIKIKDQWDPNSSNCKLKTHFYNKLNENELQILLSQPRPSNESPDDWNKAMSERPSNQYYPVKITSFSDVSERINTQIDHVKKSRYLLNLINDNQLKLSSKHDLENTVRIKNCKDKHVKLTRRLLRLATILAILKMKGYPLLPEEEEISKQFELLNSRLEDPNNSLSKLNDLFARLTILKEKSEMLNHQFHNSIDSMNDNLMDKNLVDSSSNELDFGSNEEFITKVSKLLLKHQKGLNYVNEILQKDMETADKLLK